MLVILIGSRYFAPILLGLVAHWKDGEQLRFWGAYFLLRFITELQDGVGAFCYEEIQNRKWLVGMFSFGAAFIDIVCLVVIHR